MHVSRFGIPYVVAMVMLLALPYSLSAAQPISFERIQLSAEFHSEGGTHGDYNGDGQGDVAVGPWIYYGPNFTKKSRFYGGEAFDPIRYSENFLMYSSDVNADGRMDILVLGFPGKESWWYENPGKESTESHWKQHVILDSVDNESPLVADIDQDGLDDLICSSKGQYGYATHAMQSPTELWKFVPISPNNGYQRFTHGLGIGDVNNDGRKDLLEKDGWWQNPGKQTQGEFWSFHPFEFSSGGSQMHAVDLDGDGTNEIVTGLVAHGFGLVYYKSLNPEATRFERFDIMNDDPATSPVGLAISQLHAVDVADINRDGVPDIVTGKRWWAHANKDIGNSQPATLLWLETQRSSGGRVRFVPHVIDNSSGVGTQVTVGDVNGDGLPDIVAGSKRGAYLFLQRPASMSTDQRLLPELAEADPFGQTPATESINVDDPTAGYVPALAGRRLNFDFESGDLSDWEIRGSIAAGALVENKPAGRNASGAYGFDTGSRNPKGIGELISRPFKLTHSKFGFLLSGTSDPEARVELVDEETGKVLQAAMAKSDIELRPEEFDVSNFQGKSVRIRIVDHADAGYLRVDEFRLRD